ncbi:FAS1 domain-containing protein SELMODRAFT_448915-like [Macadamia integrifolia]|uniref:FAS1 domain-containing protein SELMODRAFT_448915-like n=1 Tax=Macadamia integrifolia TaxID=60698 RepID=UPI001C528B17|nr:FAS1 domain-containing protein SELMODRAFT_448915-like [Macadamia integrifolia]XP_042476800.1 FAS1 domain-containing protein SELMODRAFT_448915-like [Macadamia integrifolia]
METSKGYAYRHHRHLVFLLIASLFFSQSAAARATTPPITPPDVSSDKQFHTIINALIGAQDFHSWARIFSITDPSTFPFSATFFVPIKDAVDRLSNSLGGGGGDFDLQTAFLSHTVPQFLTFKDLGELATGFRLPTLLPGKYIVITNNSTSNFTIDDCFITHPDLIVNGAFCVHGIASIFNFTAYGTEPEPLQNQSPPGSSSHPPGQKGFSPPVGLLPHSDAAPCSAPRFILSLLFSIGILGLGPSSLRF